MNGTLSDAEPNFISLTEDPVAQLTLIGNYVNVQMIKNCSFVGFIHAIDPITHSVILSIPKEETYQITLIPGHAILSITQTTPLPDTKPPTRKKIASTSHEDILAKKSKLIAWFKFNLLPVAESNEKILFGNVSILPPYNVSDICTDNAIVALQIRKIMEKMPLDFEAKL